MVIAGSLLDGNPSGLKLVSGAQGLVGELEWLAYVLLFLEPFLQESDMVISNRRLPTSPFHSSGVIPFHPLLQFVVFSLGDPYHLADQPLWHILTNHMLKLHLLVAVVVLLC